MWIVGTSASAQRVRANLYGALLNYLRIGKVNPGQMGKNSHEEKLKKANLEVLLGYGDAFLDIVCRDSVSGHEIRMMLALSLLDELICLEGTIFSNFSCMFVNPKKFSNLDSNCSNLLDLKNCSDLSLFEQIFLIARTIFSQSRSEQFW